MKKIATLFVLFVLTNSFDQRENAYTTGEWLKMRIHYGVVNAGYATLEVKEATKNNKKVHHVIGKGWTIGMTKFFFRVEDNYESYFDKETGKPYQFVRKIDEGGYTKNQVGFFNQNKNTVLVKDYKHDNEKTINVPEEVQDIVSSYYYLRNHPKIDKLKVGESIAIDMFFDGETFTDCVDVAFTNTPLVYENVAVVFTNPSCFITNKFPPVVPNENTFVPVFPDNENPSVAKLVDWLNVNDNATV